jgi:hypothetical protein
MRPDERQAMALLAHVLLQGGKSEKAMNLLDGLDALHPDDPATLLALAVAQIRSDRAADALRTIERVSRLGKEPALLPLLRAQALAGSGRHEQAADAMQVFLRNQGLTQP